MQTKRYYFTLVRMPIIKKAENNKNWYVVEKEGPSTLWKTEWWFLTKLKIALPHDAAVPLGGVCLCERKSVWQRDNMLLCLLQHSA